MKLLSLVIGAAMAAFGLVCVAFTAAWMHAVWAYGPEAAHQAAIGRLAVLAVISAAFLLGGWMLIRFAAAIPALQRITKEHTAARRKLAWEHVYRALVVGNPSGPLLELVETAPPVAEFVLDAAFEIGRPREVYARAQEFLRENSQHTALEPSPLPAITAELLRAAVEEACALYPKR